MLQRTILQIGSVLAAAWLLPAFAAAEEDPTSEKAAVSTTLTLKPADSDGDGKVTRAEWGQLMQRFGRLDADHDAAVNVAELQTAAETSQMPIIVKLADVDHDGRLTRPEWTRLAQSFRRLDTNHNAALELPELQAIADALAEAAKADAARPTLNGLWRGWIVDGRGENPNAGMMQIELAIAGGRIAGREVKPPAESQAGSQADAVPDLGMGSFVMTGDGQAGFFDALYIDGPHAGRLCLGLYRLEGDVLYWCVSNRTGQRPEGFATGNGFWLMILRRTPPPK